MAAASYLRPVLDASKRRTQLKYALKTLRKVQFDTIACQGVSGITTGAVLAYLFKVPLTVVRKPEDTSCHSSNRVETTLNLLRPHRFLIVDDFVATGATRDRIVSALPDWKFVGLYEFNNDVLDLTSGVTSNPPPEISDPGDLSRASASLPAWTGEPASPASTPNASSLWASVQERFRLVLPSS